MCIFIREILTENFTCSAERLFDTVKIALVGKYTDLKDSYMSVIKALEHSAFRVRRKLIIEVNISTNGSKMCCNEHFYLLHSGSSLQI